MADRRKLILSVCDHAGNEICPVYNSDMDIVGQAFDVKIKTERNGWREVSFSLPGNDYRAQYIIADYKLKAIDDYGTEWYLITQPKVTHNGKSKIISVTAGHVCQLLKTKNMALEFSDDEGNNIGTCAELLATALQGTGWEVGNVATFYEKDGTTIKKRSLNAAAKTGAFKLVTQICELFEAKPIFNSNVEVIVDGEKKIIKTVDVKPMNPFSEAKDDIYQAVTTYADGNVLELHYGTNVSNVTRTQKTDELITCLYAYGSYGDDISKYCGINECKHTQIEFTLTSDIVQDGKYYFSVIDDSGVSVTRYVMPRCDVASGTKLIWSYLDPASMMYLWDESGSGDENEIHAHRLFSDKPEMIKMGIKVGTIMELSQDFAAEYNISVEDALVHLGSLFYADGTKAKSTDRFLWKYDDDGNLVAYDSINPLPATVEIKRNEIENVFSFLMDFRYYLECGLLTDEMLDALAWFQYEAPDTLKIIEEKSAEYSADRQELSSIFGVFNFVKLKPKTYGVSGEDNAIKIELDEDRICYRTDYDAKRPFKWRVANSIKDNGDAINNEAAVVYVIHHTDPTTYDRFYLKTVDNIDDPSVITLWGDPDKASNSDSFYLFETLAGNADLGALESQEEDLVQTLNSQTKRVTIQHPVFFSKTAPSLSEFTGQTTKLDIYYPSWMNVNREYAWWYKYNDYASPGQLYFCYWADGDRSWKKAFINNAEPGSAQNGEYWFNWQTSKLYRMDNEEWIWLDGEDDKDVAEYFGMVYSKCLRRDKLYIGQYQTYTYTPDGTIPVGNYYMPNEYGEYWLFSTEYASNKLEYDTTNGFLTVTPIDPDIEIDTVAVKNATFDAVFYHKENIFDDLHIENGMIDPSSGGDDDSTDGYRTNYAPVYPNLTYFVHGNRATGRVFFYTVTKEYLGSQSLELYISTYSMVNTPNNARYIRICADSDLSQLTGQYQYWNSTIIVDDETYHFVGVPEGSGKLKGINPMIRRFYEIADRTYLNDLAAVRSAQDSYVEMQDAFKSALGELYREGWWQDSKYVDGDEDRLYDDALDNLREMAKPAVTYSINFLDLRCMDENALDENLVRWPDFDTCSAVHLVDPEIGVNCWAYVDSINKCYDKPWATTIAINTNLNMASQHSFTDIMTNIANVASQMKAKDTVYDRAANINTTGTWTAEKLEGTIDANRLKITGGSSTWYTDQNGNMVFEAADGTSAMMISGNGFALADEKDKYGDWIWRSFGTGAGFSADEIVAGKMSAERILAGTITTDHISASFGENLDITGNKGINIKIDTAKQEVKKEVLDEVEDIVEEVVEEDLEPVQREIESLDSGIELVKGRTSLIENAVWTDGTKTETRLEVQVGLVQQEITDTYERAHSLIEQNADKISWVVEGESRSEMTLTDDAMKFIGKNVDLNLSDSFNVTVGDIRNDIVDIDSRANRIFRSDDENPPSSSDVKQNDFWVHPDTGLTYQATLGSKDIIITGGVVTVSDAVVELRGLSIEDGVLISIPEPKQSDPSTYYDPLVSVENGVATFAIDGEWVLVRDEQIVDNQQRIIDTTNAFDNFLDTDYKEVASKVTQTNAYISWIVASNESMSQMWITDEALNYIGSNVNLRLNNDMDELFTWIKFDEDGMRTSASGSMYSTLVDSYGFHIDKTDEVDHIASFSKDGLKTNGMQVGTIQVKATGSGGWVWTEA